MTGPMIERVLDAFLAPEADRLPDRVVDAALAEIARTPQRLAVRVPWRFPTMSFLPASPMARAAAAFAVIAVVVGGSLFLLKPSSSIGPSGSSTATPPGLASPASDAAGPVPTSLQGTWTEDSGIEILELHGTTFKLGGFMGSVEVRGDEIRFFNSTFPGVGKECQGADSGRYRWSLSGGVLTFHLAQADDCGYRSDALNGQAYRLSAPSPS